MKNLEPYLIFSGDGEETLRFCSSCLDGKIVALQRDSESPLEIADEHGDRVFNSVFRTEGMEFMACDGLPDQPVEIGSSFALLVAFQSESDQAESFAKLCGEDTSCPAQATGLFVGLGLTGGRGHTEPRSIRREPTSSEW